MPNWCQNKLTVENPTTELYAFLEEHGFSFMKIAPYERVEDDTKNTDMQVDLWSCKWDLEEPEQKDVAGQLIIDNVAYFNTAWSPPLNVIEKLSELFPECNFILDYYEGGNWFAGTFRAFDGMGVDDELQEDDAIKEFAKEVFDEEFLDDEDEEEEETDEDFKFSADFNTDARVNSLSSYDPDDEE